MEVRSLVVMLSPDNNDWTIIISHASSFSTANAFGESLAIGFSAFSIKCVAAGRFLPVTNKKKSRIRKK